MAGHTNDPNRCAECRGIGAIAVVRNRLVDCSACGGHGFTCHDGSTCVHHAVCRRTPGRCMRTASEQESRKRLHHRIGCVLARHEACCLDDDGDRLRLQRALVDALL